MVEPPIFSKILGIPAAFFISDCIVVFLQGKLVDFPSFGIKIRRPSEYGLWETGNREGLFRENKSDKKGVFIDYDGASAAKPLVDWDLIFFDPFDIEQSGGIA